MLGGTKFKPHHNSFREYNLHKPSVQQVRLYYTFPIVRFIGRKYDQAECSKWQLDLGKARYCIKNRKKAENKRKQEKKTQREIWIS